MIGDWWDAALDHTPPAWRGAAFERANFFSWYRSLALIRLFCVKSKRLPCYGVQPPISLGDVTNHFLLLTSDSGAATSSRLRRSALTPKNSSATAAPIINNAATR